MQRRSFIKSATFGAIAVSTSGFIHFDGNRYVGDCETGGVKCTETFVNPAGKKLVMVLLKDK